MGLDKLKKQLGHVSLVLPYLVIGVFLGRMIFEQDADMPPEQSPVTCPAGTTPILEPDPWKAGNWYGCMKDGKKHGK